VHPPAATTPWTTGHLEPTRIQPRYNGAASAIAQGGRLGGWWSCRRLQVRYERRPARIPLLARALTTPKSFNMPKVRNMLYLILSP